MNHSLHQTTIGILYPGEMGTSFGKLLCKAGLRVVTTAEGRSPRTRRLCREAGLNAVESLGEVLEQSDIVISLVSPKAALTVARNVAAHRQGSSRGFVYVDANSISPMTVAQISEVLHHVSVDFVDASIFGLAAQLQQRGTLYLSGPRANELSDRLGFLPRVKAVGEKPGQASALKMIVAGIPKGLSGLFIEAMLFAQNMHLLNEALDACDEIYPSIMEVVRRMLPTYPRHAGRRCEELEEVEETMLMSGLTPRIVRAVREVTSDVAGVGWPTNGDPQQWSIVEIIKQMNQEAALHAPEFRSDQPTEQRRKDGSGPGEQAGIAVGYHALE
jgi:3-hydroxyisobutyrate dehydrogenase-like beta-hydroxyacid dehydrogenase